MNIKNISYINKKTGEVLSLTINDLATKIGVNRSTINRRLKSGKYEDDNLIISNVAPQTQMLQPNVAHESEIATLEPTLPAMAFKLPGKPIITEGFGSRMVEISQEERIQRLVESGLISREEADAMIAIQPKSDYIPKKLPQEPCILCGEPVFHTAIFKGKTQHICFGRCQPITHSTQRIQPNKEIIQMLSEHLSS